MIKIKELLSSGVFPSQLPPCFNTRSLGQKHHGITLKINKVNDLTSKKCSAIRPETYSVARIGHSRRLTSIVNPITQFYLSRLIAQNWSIIDKHYQKSSLSLSNPMIVENGGRSIKFTPLKELQEKKIIKSAGYKYVLISDVSQFFPTLYTHTIGWALDGKDIAKPKQYAKNLHPNDFGILLDRKIGNCQSNQTIGIPIGPDTSHIIAELVATGVDIELLKLLEDKPAGFRFVDDYYLFFETQQAAEDALSKLSNSMSTYELKINAVKTKITSLEELSEDTWKYSLQQFYFEQAKKKQRNSINHYFDLAFRTAKTHQDENVMVYAIRRIKGVIVKKKNWELFESYLCKVLISYPNAMQDIAHILFTYNYYGYISDKDRISRSLNRLILDHAILEHHSEIAWALWLSRELNIKIKAESCRVLSQIKSSVCLILAYDLQLNGLLEEPLDITKFSELLNEKELWRTNWLLAYEAGIRNWMGADHSKIKNDTYFGILDSYNISFYDSSSKLDLLFVPKYQITDEVLNQYFESDADLENEFDFMEETEDYSDLREHTFSEIIESFEDLDDDNVNKIPEEDLDPLF